jgi:MFS family permease
VNEGAPVTFLGMLMDRRTRWNFLSEAGNAALVGLFIGVVGPFTIPLAIRLGATPLQVALISAAPFIANLLAPYWAGLSHYSRKLPWVIVPHLIWRGGMGLVGIFAHPAALVWIFVSTHVAVAAANPAYGALVQRVYPTAIRGRLMGYVRLLLAAAMLPTALIAGGLIDRFGPQWVFLGAGACGVVGLAVYALTKEPADSPLPSGPLSRPSPLQGLKLAVSDPPFRRYLLATIIFHGGVLVAHPLYGAYQVREMGLSNVQIGYIALAWNLAWLGSFALWGRVIDWKGPRPVVIAAAAFYLGLPLAYGLGGGLFAVVLLGAMCQGIADAALDLGGWNMILSVNPDRVGQYTSAAMMATGVRGAIGPFLGTALLGWVGFQATFLTAGLLIAIGLAVLLMGTGRSAQP